MFQGFWRRQHPDGDLRSVAEQRVSDETLAWSEHPYEITARGIDLDHV